MNKATSETIAHRIKQAREKHGFNQARLASEAEITPAAISQIESGERTPSTPVLRKIATVLMVSTDYLLGKTNESELKDLLEDEGIQTFFRGFQGLSSQDQEHIKQQIEFLKSLKLKKK